MYYAEFCAPLKSRATATIYRLYLNAIELLPIRIMFIDRIIVRMWFSAVALSSELLNLAQIEPCCRVVVECDSLLAAENSVIKRCSQCKYPILCDNAIYSSLVYFLMVSKPDRITPQQMFFSIVWDISLWSNQWWVSLFSHPLIFFPLFRKHFNISQARYQSIHESQIINIS